MTLSSERTTPNYIAFDGPRRIAQGLLTEVAVQAKRCIGQSAHGSVLIFDAQTSQAVELDFRGSVADVLGRLPAEAPALPAAADVAAGEAPADTSPRGRGRPRLGVVAREVTLLPRHWAWLASQPGGASVALRKLVEEARRANAGRDAARTARESAYRFMSVMGSGQASFEEATRALFAEQRAAFEIQMQSWPTDVRAHAMSLAQPSFALAESVA